MSLYIINMEMIILWFFFNNECLLFAQKHTSYIRFIHNMSIFIKNDIIHMISRQDYFGQIVHISFVIYTKYCQYF